MSARYKNRKYQIPKDWAWREIEDIAFVLSGSTPKGLNDQASSELEEFPFYKVSDMNNEGNKIKMNVSNLYLNETQVKKLGVKIHPQDTIIFPKRGGAILTNKKRLLSKPAGYDLNLMGLKTRHFGVSDLYLWYWFQRINLSSLYDGSNVPQINNKDIAPLFFPIAPLPEQRAIVAKIEQLFSELDNGIANLKAAKDKLEIYRQAVLKKAFEGELTKEWREQNPYNEKDLVELLEYIEDFNANKAGQDIPRRLPPIDLSDLHELPYGWIWQEAHKICSSVRDGTHDTPKYVDEGVPLITSKNLKNGVIDMENVDLISEADHEDICKRSAVEENDILYGMIGTIGNPVIVKQTNAFSIKNVGLFKKNETLLIPKYFQYYLTSWVVEHIMRQKELIRGTTQKFVALGGLRVLPIPLPSKKEQEQIIYEIESRLSVCDNILANIEEGLEKSEALRQSILKQAFDGKLLSEEELEACRKEQDWEPAEKLLERIKNEKLAEA